MRKKQYLNRQRQPSMQRNNDNQQDLARPYIRRAQDGVQVAEQKQRRDAEAQTDKDVVEDGDGRPGDECHGDPDQVCVAVQTPAFEEIGGLAAEPFEGEEETDWDETCIVLASSFRP
jgi:hypothetical protein